jgi:sugar/nucleoside kinase (ribokinase family)
LDETGSGDCFLALLMLELIKFSEFPFQPIDYHKAISIASAGSSLLVEQSGLNGFKSRDAIRARVKTGKKYEKSHTF